MKLSPSVWQVTYEAHKEYLAKMYEEYQRQEEENIKKGKKGLVSTISGLSAQASAIKGTLELDPDSQTQTPESEADEPETTDPERNLLSDAKSLDVENSASGVHVEVHDLLVDIKAEKVEATEVKMDDMDLLPETLSVTENGGLVEVDCLLDNVYSAAVEKINSSVNGVLVPQSNLEDKTTGPLINLADEKDAISSNSTFLFGTMASSSGENLLPEIGPSESFQLSGVEPQVHTSSSDLGLLALMAKSSKALDANPTALEDDSFKLQCAVSGLGISEGESLSKCPGQIEPVAVELEAEVPGAKSRADVTSFTSDTDKSDDGKDKEIKKIQTTATTQVGVPVHLCITKDIRRNVHGFG